MPTDKETARNFLIFIKKLYKLVELPKEERLKIVKNANG